MFFVFLKRKKKTQYPLNLTKTVTKNSNDCGIQNSDVLKKKKKGTFFTASFMYQ